MVFERAASCMPRNSHSVIQIMTAVSCDRGAAPAPVCSPTSWRGILVATVLFRPPLLLARSSRARGRPFLRGRGGRLLLRRVLRPAALALDAPAQRVHQVDHPRAGAFRLL